MHSKVLKGASIVGASQVVIAISTFTRNILVARLISVEDYGIATTFAVTLAMIEMTSNLAFDKILVQDKSGGSDDMLASAHFLHFLKSAATSLILLLVGPLMARLFDLESIIWAFQLLALIPLIRGLKHFDYVTFQREMNFLPHALINTSPQILTLLLAYPLGIWLGDFRVMLALVVAQPTVYVFLSHIWAVRPYRWIVNKRLIMQKIRFGWPLLIDGLLLFLIFNGDKTIVGYGYDMKTLGWYGIAFSLTLLPTLIFSRLCMTLFLPILSKFNREADPAFTGGAVVTTSVCFCIAACSYLLFVIAGEAVIYLCYGERYLEATQVISLLALVQAIHIARTAPIIISVSQSNTKISMYSNIVRCLVIPGALIAANNGSSIEWIVYWGIAGELLALITSVAFTQVPENYGTFLKAVLTDCIKFVAVGLFGFLVVKYFPSNPLDLKSALLQILISVSICCMVATVYFFSNANLRLLLKKIILAKT